MKNNVSLEQRDAVRREIKNFMREDSNSISAFSKNYGMSRTSIDKWFGEDRLPSIQTALKLEKISKGRLTKEFLCPYLEWNE